LALYVRQTANAPVIRTWLRHHPLDLVIVVFTPPLLPPGLQGLLTGSIAQRFLADTPDRS